jgi:hypothetical protein
LSLDDEGFLSKEIDDFRNGIRSKHQAYFDLIERLNRYCQQTKYRLVVHNRDGQELFTACLVIKLLNDVQAAIILLERRLASQGRSMLRVALECLVVLAKITQSYEFVHAYVKVGEQDRLKLVKAIRQNPNQGFDDVRADLTDDLIAAIKEQLVKHKIDATLNSGRRTWASAISMMGPIGCSLKKSTLHREPLINISWLMARGE